MGKTVNPQCPVPTRSSEPDSPAETEHCPSEYRPYPRGLPRPIGEHRSQGKLPVPWSQEVSDPDDGPLWGQVRCDDEYREDLARNCCLLCGEVVKQGVLFLDVAAPTKTPVQELSKSIIAMKQPCDESALRKLDSIVVDHGVLHERCGKMTEAHCKSINEALKAGRYLKIPFRSRFSA